jgi:soluble lytic murein transglycosylase-like protein
MQALATSTPAPYGDIQAQTFATRGRELGNETALLKLADLKRSQASEEQVVLAIKNDPELARLIFGGSTIGGLETAPPTPGAPQPGAITQSPLGGGPAQQIPAYPNASQFATQGAPDQRPRGFAPEGAQPRSILASLGPAGQPQMQAPQRNPVLEMAQRDPRAAMMLQQQMQGAQEQRWKMDERRLDMGVKIAEAVAQELNGVRDQASLDAARARVQQYHPQAAAQIPQFYSKEALEPLIMKGVAVKDLALWRKNMAQARQADMMTEQLPGTFKALEQFATGGGAQAPGSEAAATTAALQTGQQARTAPPEYESAITEANRLYPQVKVERIKSIIAAESNFDAKAVSPAGAKGLMQLMDGTAKEMGVDDPFNVQENVRGGTRYYAQMLTRYGGDERKALAAYNWGPGNLDKVNGDVSKAPAETQAYVAKVLGGGSPGAGSTGIAQAPTANPKIAQLDTRIKEGQALALRLSATPGMEQAATMVNQQVNDLQKDRDRLDAPRQEYLKKQAVQGLELEQKQQEGVARAQLEADTKPATNAEIDAINRGLPREKQLSYGTTYKEIREKKLVGGGTLDPTVTKDIINTTTAIQQFEELNNAVTQLPTGPLTQYVEQFKERWGIDISDEKVAQRAILAGAQSQLLNARSGTAVSPSEYTRLMNELPNESNDPKVFKARLANTLRQFKNIYKTRVQVLRKLGHAIPDDLMEPLAAPEAAPVAKPSTAVDRARDAMRR